MGEKPRPPIIPRTDSGQMRAVEEVGHVLSLPPPPIDPEVDRRLRAIEDGHGARITSLESSFAGLKTGVEAHVNLTVTAAIDAKLTEKLAPLRAQITGEFTQQNVMLADISVFVKTIAKRMHGLAMDSSAELQAQHEPIAKAIDGTRKHRIASITAACLIVSTLLALGAFAINSWRGQPVSAPPPVVAPAHH